MDRSSTPPRGTATAYNTSSFGYTYNDVEALLATKFGEVHAARANHHGSSRSSSSQYVTTLSPKVGIISCGVNTYGHPGNRVLDAFRAVSADIFLTNNPCDDADDTGPINYGGTFNTNGRVWLATANSGATFDVTYDGGTRSYVTSSGGGGGGGSPADIRVNEFMMAPQSSGTNEWIELVNPTATAIDVSGNYVDDLADGGGAPKQIPAGTVIPAGGRWVYEFASGYLNNTGSESVRFLRIQGGTETVYDTYGYSLGSTQYDKVFHRVGDGGAWCDTISSNVTKGTANPAICP